MLRRPKRRVARAPLFTDGTPPRCVPMFFSRDEFAVTPRRRRRDAPGAQGARYAPPLKPLRLLPSSRKLPSSDGIPRRCALDMHALPPYALRHDACCSRRRRQAFTRLLRDRRAHASMPQTAHAALRQPRARRLPLPQRMPRRPTPASSSPAAAPRTRCLMAFRVQMPSTKRAATFQNQTKMNDIRRGAQA
jgi:hypothetical protein